MGRGMECQPCSILLKSGKAIEVPRPGKLEKPHEEGIKGGEVGFFVLEKHTFPACGG